MLLGAYRMLCFACCGVGCQAQIDFSGLDGGVGSGRIATFAANTFGGSQAMGGAESQGGTGPTGGSSEVCNGATCEAPVVLTSNLDLPGPMAIDGKYVYWLDWLRGAVEKVPLDGGTPITLASGQDDPEYIAVDDSYVYWTNTNGTNGGGGSLQKVLLSGGTPITIASLAAFSSNLAVNATGVYWAVSTDRGNASYLNTILRYPLEGGTPTTLVSGEEGFTDGLALDDTNLYWVNILPQNSDYTCAGTVKKIPLGGGTPTTLASAQDHFFGLVVDATNAYWENDSGGDLMSDCGGSIMSVPIAGGAPKQLATSNVFYRADVVMDGMYLYWVSGCSMSYDYDTCTRTIKKVPLAGGVTTTVYAAPESYMINGLAVDATHIYWAMGTGNPCEGQVLKLRLH